jgi:hypothetical protein
VKQPSVRSLQLKTKRFIAAVKNRCVSNGSCALATYSAPLLVADACEYGHEGLGSIHGADYGDLYLIELFLKGFDAMSYPGTLSLLI